MAVDEVVIRPRWYRNFFLAASSFVFAFLVLTFGAVLTGALAGGWGVWLGLIFYTWLAAFWCQAAVRTCVRCDDQGLRSDRPMSKLAAELSWAEIARFFDSGGAVKAELLGGGSLVVLDRSGDSRRITQRLEDERARRQRTPSG